MHAHKDHGVGLIVLGMIACGGSSPGLQDPPERDAGVQAQGEADSGSGRGVDAATVEAGRPLRKEDYAVDCAADGDCVLADFSPNVCCGGCDDSAIGRREQARYRSDKSASRSKCTTEPCPAMA